MKKVHLCLNAQKAGLPPDNAWKDFSELVGSIKQAKVHHHTDGKFYRLVSHDGKRIWVEVGEDWHKPRKVSIGGKDIRVPALARDMTDIVVATRKPEGSNESGVEVDLTLDYTP